MRSTMSFQAKRELLRQVAPRYQAAPHGQRSVILDEFIAATGYARTYAIRLLTSPIIPPGWIKRPRPARYGPAVREALEVAWRTANGICAKRLVPFLPELVPALERPLPAHPDPDGRGHRLDGVFAPQAPHPARRHPGPRPHPGAAAGAAAGAGHRQRR